MAIAKTMTTRNTEADRRNVRERTPKSYLPLIEMPDESQRSRKLSTALIFLRRCLSGNQFRSIVSAFLRDAAVRRFTAASDSQSAQPLHREAGSEGGGQALVGGDETTFGLHGQGDVEAAVNCAAVSDRQVQSLRHDIERGKSRDVKIAEEGHRGGSVVR